MAIGATVGTGATAAGAVTVAMGATVGTGATAAGAVTVGVGEGPASPLLPHAAPSTTTASAALVRYKTRRTVGLLSNQLAVM